MTSEEITMQQKARRIRYLRRALKGGLVKKDTLMLCEHGNDRSICPLDNPLSWDQWNSQLLRDLRDAK